MSLEAVSQTWVTFVSGDDEVRLNSIAAQAHTGLNHYCIESVVPVLGTTPPGLLPGQTLIRVENTFPIEIHGSAKLLTTFTGVTQHLHYTSVRQQEQLAHSHIEFAPSAETTAVLIPIRKSADWWQLAQDERYAHFQSRWNYEGHTAIGLHYVDRVHRKLYHSRYLTPPSPYDFLTYFEFQSADRDYFRSLLDELRSQTTNPEWAYVETEFEIWMAKVG